MTECAGTEFRATGKVTHDLPLGQLGRDFFGQIFLLGINLVDRVHGIEFLPHRSWGEFRPEIRSPLGIPPFGAAWIILHLVPAPQCGTKRSSGIAGRRLDPDVLKKLFTEKAAIGDTIKGDSTGQTKILRPGRAADMTRHLEDNIFGHRLYARRHIHVALSQLFVRLPRRAAEKRVKAGIGHGQALAIIKIPLVQPERTIVLDLDEVLAHQVGKARFAIGGKTHEFVLTRINLESAIRGESAVEQSERMGKADFGAQLDPVAPPDSPAGCRPLPHPIHRENGCLLERAGKKGARRMRLVVAAKINRSGVVAAQTLVDFSRQVQLGLQPLRHGPKKGEEPAGGNGEVSLEQALELQQWLLVENHRIQITVRDSAGFEAIANRAFRKPLIVLLPRKSFLLSCGHNLPVAHQRGRAVVVEGGNTEDIHQIAKIERAGKPRQIYGQPFIREILCGLPAPWVAKLLHDAAQILPVERLTETVSACGQLVFAQPPLMERDLLQAGDHQALARLDSMNERRGIEQRLGRACVQPRCATAEFLRAQ